MDSAAMQMAKGPDTSPPRHAPNEAATREATIARAERSGDAPRTTVDGSVRVTARAIASIAAQAAMECYGVVGLAPRHSGLRQIRRLPAGEATRGIETRFVDDHVVIDVWVILEHHLRVIEVAHNLMTIVKYAVEEALGLRVVRVNVNVRAISAGPWLAEPERPMP